MVDAEKGAGPSNAGPKNNQYEGMWTLIKTTINVVFSNFKC